MENIRTMITYGMVDLLYAGHINLLKGLSDYLIVGLSTDHLNIYIDKLGNKSEKQRSLCKVNYLLGQKTSPLR